MYKTIKNMKYETKKVDAEKGIVQVTTTDERWYQIGDKFVPSVTWILHKGYPKGYQLLKWYADKGMTEAEQIKNAAADKGSKVHAAVTDILKGIEVKHDAKYLNNGTGQDEELTPEEYGCVMSFVSWLKETNPEVLAIDYTVINEAEGYAGTVDMKLKLNGEVWLIDIKTSKSVWPEFELQVSAYKHADADVQKLAILQVGYERNKSKFKFTEVQDQFSLFIDAKHIWAKQCEGEQPAQKDYPLSLQWKRFGVEKPVEVKTKKVAKKRIVKKKK